MTDLERDARIRRERDAEWCEALTTEHPNVVERVTRCFNELRHDRALADSPPPASGPGLADRGASADTTAQGRSESLGGSADVAAIRRAALEEAAEVARERMRFSSGPNAPDRREEAGVIAVALLALAQAPNDATAPIPTRTPKHHDSPGPAAPSTAVAAGDSPTWPWVLAFARAMESKLDENRHKGNREGWRNDAPLALFARLRQEVEELATVLPRPLTVRGADDQAYTAGSPRQIIGECADVANFAMMIADVAGSGRLAAAPTRADSPPNFLNLSPAAMKTQHALASPTEDGVITAARYMSDAMQSVLAASPPIPPSEPRGPELWEDVGRLICDYMKQGEGFTVSADKRFFARALEAMCARREFAAGRAALAARSGEGLAEWYEADGSVTMLPAAEVVRRRKLAAVVLEKARIVLRPKHAWADDGMDDLAEALRDLDAADRKEPQP